MQFYLLENTCGSSGPGCGATANAGSLHAFSSIYTVESEGRWISVYRVVSVLAVHGLTVIYHRRRGISTGLRARTWPAAATGLLLLLLALMSLGRLGFLPTTFGINGTGPLAIIAMSLLALARTERDASFGAFVPGYFALVCASLFYGVINAFQRIGLSGPFGGGSAALLPNLVVPGIYLLLGGFLFWNSAQKSALVEGDLRD